jgi:hypothetical protein
VSTHNSFITIGNLLGPARDYRIGSNFWKFYLMRTSVTLRELVSLVKVFRLFRSEWIFLLFRLWTQEVDVQHIIYWQARVFVMPSLFCYAKMSQTIAPGCVLGIIGNLSMQHWGAPKWFWNG